MNKFILYGVLLFCTLEFSTLNVFSQDKEEVEQFVEISPSFPGGDSARIKFLADHLNYPLMAKENNIEGTVYVTFVVEKDGTITHVKVIRGIGGGCDEEVIRVVRMMPKWLPGYQKGKAVRAQFNMPIKFTLTGGNTERIKKRAQRKLKKEEKRKLKP